MSFLIYIATYLAIVAFAVSVVMRVISYLKNPLHLRWELYPVAHEGERAEYGGSYLEEVDWWTKPRQVSLAGELKVMIPEILFLKAVWEHNRSLWYLTFPFHFGLYLIIAFLGLLAAGAVAQLLGMAVGAGQGLIGALLFSLPALLGPVAMVVCLLGAVGLFLRRLLDEDLRRYSSISHYFNLAFFIAVLALALLTWSSQDGDFGMARAFIAGLLTFNFAEVGQPLFVVQVLAACVLMAYIPMTHMSHFFMKYFLYHDIRWGDEPNVNAPHTAEQIATVLNYPVTWSAPHVAIPGKKTWAEIATHNPMAEEKKES